MKKQTSITNKALAAVMGAESGVTPPPRSRSSSFASMVADMEVGDPPAARTVALNAEVPLFDALATMTDESERLRNNVTSAVQQAKRKRPGHEFSIEITNVTTKTGMYLLALVHRTA